MAYASRQSSYLVAGLGGFLQVIAGWWDVFSHILYGSVDPWWNPAHLTLYSAIAITIIGVWRGMRAHPAQHASSFPMIRFVNLAGLKLVAVGCVIEIIAGGWNEIVHHIIRSEPRIAPAHALLTIGMLTVNLGAVIGLTIEYGMIRHELLIAAPIRRTAVASILILNFSAIWLTAAGDLIYLANAFRSYSLNWTTAFLLALFAAFTLVPLKRVIPTIGSATSVGIVFSAVAYLFLVVDAGSSYYIPWAILPIVLFELLVWRLGAKIGLKRALLVSSIMIGVFFGMTYYPFTVYLFPWSFSVSPLIAIPAAGSLIGALLGERVYGALSSLVLRDVPARF